MVKQFFLPIESKSSIQKYTPYVNHKSNVSIHFNLNEHDFTSMWIWKKY
ncbi:hypothetical protein BpHYR1_009615 [Brachionus plicatilis]|uniref:Uncharacterized protein n=1 Tax=Brachionus plicatilis TaxID=10195 RepID=A0A3M7T5J8_BRAPC|nr:hypothetical protein BpHYR1_009615 [Brachionus plicatilis]